jgi:hypothetical protein
MPKVYNSLVINGQLYYNNNPQQGWFLVTDSTGLITLTNSVTGDDLKIGPAQNGTYADGLFSNFTSETRVGHAVDKFNEILKNLVPPAAPELRSWNSTGNSGVSGKLTFDDSSPIVGSVYIGANNSPSSVSVDGSWMVSGKRLGIYARGSQDYLGILNFDVPQSTTTPTAAYSAKSFTDGDKGNLVLKLNGIEISNIDLTNLSAQSVLTAGSGLNVSAATSSKFPIGTTFDQFQNRTGDWIIKSDNTNIVNGYNYIIVEHTDASFTDRILERFEFIIDHDNTSTIISGATISSYSFGGSKYLSGIRYYTSGWIKYGAQIDNLYRNTYYRSTDAITYSDLYGGLLITTRQDALPNSSGDEGKTILLKDLNSSNDIQFNIVSSGKRRLDESIGINLTAKRTVALAPRTLTTTGGGVQVDNIYLDNYNMTSVDKIEYFDDEDKRLKSGIDYDLIGDINNSNKWDSEESLQNSGLSGYNNGLQVIGGLLKYPSIDFSSIGILQTNLNNSVSSTNYSTCTGERTYIRWFRQQLPTTAQFRINISGVGVTFVSKSTALTGSNAWLEIKLPGISSKVTGWLDCYTDYNPAIGVSNDGDGCRYSTNGSGGLGNDLGLFTGTVGTALSAGYVLVKITVGQYFNQNLSQIDFNFS